MTFIFEFSSSSQDESVKLEKGPPIDSGPAAV